MTETPNDTNRQRYPWPHEELAYDFATAVTGADYSSPDTRSVGIGSPALPALTLFEIEKVERWKVSYHGTEWKPGDVTGSELSLVAVLRLRDGRWASAEAWNDYTGWGCQDHSDVRIGTTEDAVVHQGLSTEGRSTLGYTPTDAS